VVSIVNNQRKETLRVGDFRLGCFSASFKPSTLVSAQIVPNIPLYLSMVVATSTSTSRYDRNLSNKKQKNHEYTLTALPLRIVILLHVLYILSLLTLPTFDALR